MPEGQSEQLPPLQPPLPLEDINQQPESAIVEQPISNSAGTQSAPNETTPPKRSKRTPYTIMQGEERLSIIWANNGSFTAVNDEGKVVPLNQTNTAIVQSHSEFAIRKPLQRRFQQRDVIARDARKKKASGR